MKEIPTDLLRQLLRYEPETGKLFWLVRDSSLFRDTPNKTAEQHCRGWNKRFAGAEAFTADGVKGCKCGRILGVGYYAHRVAYALHEGEWPENEIDHEDGNRANNRWKNLRDATHLLNMKNKRLYRSNRSGHHGVYQRNGRGGWIAHIRVDGVRRQIGTFSTKDAAIEARKAAQPATFHPNHGRIGP